HFLDFAFALIDPNLDDVRPVRGVLLNRPARFRFAVDLQRRTVRFGAGNAFTGAEKARGAGNKLVAHAEQVEAILAEAQRGADTEIGAPLQVANERVTGRAEMGVRVDDHRHDGFAGEVHAR